MSQVHGITVDSGLICVQLYCRGSRSSRSLYTRNRIKHQTSRTILNERGCFIFSRFVAHHTLTFCLTTKVPFLIYWQRVWLGIFFLFSSAFISFIRWTFFCNQFGVESLHWRFVRIFVSKLRNWPCIIMTLCPTRPPLGNFWSCGEKTAWSSRWLWARSPLGAASESLDVCVRKTQRPLSGFHL